MINKSIKVLTN